MEYDRRVSSTPRVILLAAGQGKRMQALGVDVPKSLLPVGGEPFVVRLAGQAFAHGVTDVTAVVGYRKDDVKQALAARFGDRVSFVDNDRYAEDVNIHSLCLALERDASPFHVVEADIYLADGWDVLLDQADRERSIWYTRGTVRPGQAGGMLTSGDDGRITDLRVEPTPDPRFAAYKKLVGITKVGPAQVERYHRLLVEARDRNMRQYYLAPWIEHLGELSCFERDLGAEVAFSVNTPQEYRQLVSDVERQAH